MNAYGAAPELGTVSIDPFSELAKDDTEVTKKEVKYHMN
jgi:hypothetical protein